MRALFQVGGFVTETELKKFITEKSRDGKISVADFKSEMRRRKASGQAALSKLNSNPFTQLAQEGVTQGAEIEDILKCLKEKLLQKELTKWSELTGIKLQGRVDASKTWAKMTEFAR
eukprot:g5284.t1